MLFFTRCDFSLLSLSMFVNWWFLVWRRPILS